jgi:hypothetical protein
VADLQRQRQLSAALAIIAAATPEEKWEREGAQTRLKFPGGCFFARDWNDSTRFS